MFEVGGLRAIRPDPNGRDAVRVGRIAEAVADNIRELILDEEFRDGEHLPRVEILSERFGVASTAVRQALRILEGEGLVVVRRGTLGGAVARRPDEAMAAYLATLVLRSRHAQLRDVFETRIHIESLCAMLCARRPDKTKAVLPRLRRLTDEAQQLDLAGPAFVDAMVLFHEALVESCGSKTLTLLAGIVERITSVNTMAWAREAGREEDPATMASRLRSLEYHEQLCDLIEAGEDLEVAKVMAQHSADMCLAETWISGLDLSNLVDASVIKSTRPH